MISGFDFGNGSQIIGGLNCSIKEGVRKGEKELDLQKVDETVTVVFRLITSL